MLPYYFCVAGKEDNVHAKKNYEKYLSALKNSGLVSVEEKAQAVAADHTAGAEGGAGALGLLGMTSHLWASWWLNELGVCYCTFNILGLKPACGLCLVSSLVTPIFPVSLQYMITAKKQK